MLLLVAALAGLTAVEAAPPAGLAGLAAVEAAPPAGLAGLAAVEAAPPAGLAGLAAVEAAPPAGLAGLAAVEVAPPPGLAGLAGLATNSSRRDDMKPFVVGGQDARPGQFPELVSIQAGTQNVHLCGGFIIDPRWIVTAGHCLDQVDPDALTILAGTTDLSSRGGVRMKIGEYDIHEDYGVVGGSSLTHDIALIKMYEDLPLNEYIQVASLQNTESQDGEPVQVAGWGMTSNDDFTASDTLQWTSLQIVANDLCEAILGDAQILDDQICAGSPDADGAECRGDSGGALFADGLVVGIVSWSKKPCGKYPGVFSSIARHYDWIRERSGLENL